jgi:hypothetical protein
MTMTGSPSVSVTQVSSVAGPAIRMRAMCVLGSWRVPVAIETPEGKAEYVARQRAFAERATSVRTRLVAACEVLGRTSVE